MLMSFIICARVSDEGDDMNILGGRRVQKYNILYNRVFPCT